MAHQLCQRCQQLQFVLHEATSCASLHCTVIAFRPNVAPLHSALVDHYPSFDELENSSHQSCHLCSLIIAGLRSRLNANPACANEENLAVKLAFECYTGGAYDVREHLIAICGQTIAEFKIAIVPRIQCCNPYYEQTRPFTKPGGDPDKGNILFRALYIGEEDNELQLVPGEYFGVFDAPGDFWFARSIPNRKPGHTTFRQKMWLHKSLFGECRFPSHADCACGKGVWEPPRWADQEFGYIPSNAEAILPLIRDWLAVCDSAHGTCRISSSETRPARLIEIANFDNGHLRLVNGTICDDKYITLSYRWGDTPHSAYITTTANYKPRQDAFRMDTMPRTICDTITVTHLLGAKYIWIDAMYDSRADWELEGSRMDQIYTNSYLTISADDTPDTQAGFLHVRNPLAEESCIHPSLVARYNSPTPGSSYSNHHPRWTTQEMRNQPGLSVPEGPRAICCGIEEAEKNMNTSLLNSRGWILQERLLSRKILHWGAQEVSWECNGMIASERKPAGRPSDIGTVQIRDILHPSQTFDAEDHWSTHVSSEACAKWHELVQQYTARNLTVKSDRLPAVQGLSNAFGKALQRKHEDYIFGLWKSKMAYDLCWKATPKLGGESHGAWRNSGVPTFTWASISAPVTFLEEWLYEMCTDSVQILQDSKMTGGEPRIAPPSVSLNGLMFDFHILSRTRLENRFNDSDGMIDAISWDTEDLGHKGRDLSCICFGILTKLDGTNIPRDNQGMFGIILEPQGALYRRVGFYDGLWPELDVQNAEREVVTII